MNSKIKNLLLSIGLSIPLVFGSVNYTINAQENEKVKNEKSIEKILEIPEPVRILAEYYSSCPKEDRPVLVRLARDIDTYVVTSKNGYHLNQIAEKFGIKPIEREGGYSNYDIGFYSTNTDMLKYLSDKLDKNKDKIISIDELFEFY